MKTLLLLAVASTFTLSSVGQAAQSDTGYANPVYRSNFPDPNLVKAKDGYFYAYATNGGKYTIPVVKSKDLVNWTFVGDAFEKRPDWKKDGGGIWAPDVTYYRKKYLMFYSWSLWGDPNPAIGVAVSQKPEGPFTDLGSLFYSKEIGVANSIDPFLYVDKQTPYLIWGSFHGIYGIELTKDGTHIKGEKFQLADNQYEGSYIYKRGKYYYYFGSAGTCCEGVKSTYRVKVGRSLSLKGPYLDQNGRSLMEGGGTLLLEGNSTFAGPGHNGDIVEDKKHQTWFVYHAFSRENTKGREMLLDKIEWVNDWPVIKDKQPSLHSDSPSF
jgi:arabinan endo-1,5-alpha-L-arabinosidase